MPAKASPSIASSKASTDSSSFEDVPLIFYPAYCFKVSPTWFTWVKLTAYDIHHRLTVRHDFKAIPVQPQEENNWIQNQPLLLFYLNHPIQFVQLVGIVVTFDNYFDNFWLFTVDDSSGATIEVNCRKPLKSEKVQDGNTQPVQEKDVEAEKRNEAMNKINIGTVVQVKGQITTFRNVRQLQLDRISIICETNQEMRLIAARTEFYNKVLGQPWELDSVAQKSLREQALCEKDAGVSRTRKRQKAVQASMEREKRHAERVLKQYEIDEQKRHKGAEDARVAALSMKRCH